ncbi:pyridoxamine 5'-phosphate oxidase family protein [Chloroflexota bacterium]
MRRKEREITDFNEIEEIIKKATSCRIGLVDGDEPYVVPVCFGYERNTLYFHCALEGRKVEIIKKNNNVCLEIDVDVEVTKSDDPCNWAVKYRSVIGVGKAHILRSDTEKSRALKLITRHYSDGEFNFPKPKLDSVLVVKVEIESITGKKVGY